MVAQGEFMGQVFISHSTKNDGFVSRLVNILEQNGMQSFVDHDVIKYGMRWEEEVQKALVNCDQMIAVISPHSIESRNCRNEWYYFLNHNKEIVPIWLSGDDMYFEFETVQWVDFRDETEFDNRVQQLVGYLTDREKLASPSITMQYKAQQMQPNLDDVLPAELYLRYPLVRRADKWIGIATGNIAELKGVDVLANSENTQLQMDRMWHRTVSSALNAFAAKWDEYGKVALEATLEIELAQASTHLTRPVPLTTVIMTSPGSLARNGVRHIAHVVSVDVEPGKIVSATYVQLRQCVKNCLKEIDKLNHIVYQDDTVLPLKRVVMPIFSTGNAQQKLDHVTPKIVEAAIEYLEYEDTQVEEVYFVAYQGRSLAELESSLVRLYSMGDIGPGESPVKSVTA